MFYSQSSSKVGSTVFSLWIKASMCSSTKMLLWRRNKRVFRGWMTEWWKLQLLENSFNYFIYRTHHKRQNNYQLSLMKNQKLFYFSENWRNSTLISTCCISHQSKSPETFSDERQIQGHWLVSGWMDAALPADLELDLVTLWSSRDLSWEHVLVYSNTSASRLWTGFWSLVRAARRTGMQDWWRPLCLPAGLVSNVLLTVADQLWCHSGFFFNVALNVSTLDLSLCPFSLIIRRLFMCSITLRLTSTLMWDVSPESSVSVSVPVQLWRLYCSSPGSLWVGWF